ncbi:Glycosyl transferase family 2 [Natronincola peptidivorans]|uniref:Glycosyl transferase family 2 n=1 Tax=Natronincola peptidivorans TaxID=426128 RepID=A0A1H9YHA9_9FIRM|nr:Glycosyl transferase family 2 [Natronincola peptidivorans]
MKISAIIPAYNEENRIKDVIEPIYKSKLVTEIIAIDDGSEDNTFLVINEYSNINGIQLRENKGKAEAIKIGLKDCDADIILLIDADLVGLKSHHIESLLEPLLKEDYEMTVGIFHSGRFITDLAQKFAPDLSGQRAFKRSLAQDIIDLNMSGYSLEIAISQYVRKNNIKTKYVVLEDISHIMKEEKLGLTKGMVWRLKMYKDILKHWVN